MALRAPSVDGPENASSETETQNDQSSSIHLLPCSIDFDGTTAVSSYFRITKDTLNDELRSHFRGRALRGLKVKLPGGTQGLCVAKALNGETKKVEWEIIDKFECIHDWQHDNAPDSKHLTDYFDWFEIAKSVSECSIFGHNIAVFIYSMFFYVPHSPRYILIDSCIEFRGLSNKPFNFFN